MGNLTNLTEQISILNSDNPESLQKQIKQVLERIDVYEGEIFVIDTSTHDCIQPEEITSPPRNKALLSAGFPSVHIPKECLFLYISSLYKPLIDFQETLGLEPSTLGNCPKPKVVLLKLDSCLSIRSDDSEAFHEKFINGEILSKNVQTRSFMWKLVLICELLCAAWSFNQKNTKFILIDSFTSQDK